MERKKSGSGFKMKSPLKTRLGRFLLGRKKEKGPSGEDVIVNRKGKVVKTKQHGVTTKYKKGNRPEVASYQFGGDARFTKKGRIVHY